MADEHNPPLMTTALQHFLERPAPITIGSRVRKKTSSTELPSSGVGVVIAMSMDGKRAFIKLAGRKKEALSVATCDLERC
jgi:hypothetical protein